MNWEKAKTKVHDASGVEHPELWTWERDEETNVYLPAKLIHHKVIDVTKCGDCPYFNPVTNGDTVFGATCLHPKGNSNVWVIAAKIPEWCPLEDAEDFAESNFNPDRD